MLITMHAQLYTTSHIHRKIVGLLNHSYASPMNLIYQRHASQVIPLVTNSVPMKRQNLPFFRSRCCVNWLHYSILWPFVAIYLLCSFRLIWAYLTSVLRWDPIEVSVPRWDAITSFHLLEIFVHYRIVAIAWELLKIPCKLQGQA